ncbi:MAG: hypothetical protein INR71_15350 [Terriglobus roseus]|nr:hypothetical protein [Terriglobus roseus]
MCTASLDVKLKAPNGVSFSTKGTSPHEGSISSSVSLLHSAPNHQASF